MIQELGFWPKLLDVYQHWWIRIQPIREPSRCPHSSIYRTSTSHYKLDWIHGSYRTSTRRQAEKALHHCSGQGDHLQHAHRKSTPPASIQPVLVLTGLLSSAQTCPKSCVATGLSRAQRETCAAPWRATRRSRDQASHARKILHRPWQHARQAEARG